MAHESMAAGGANLAVVVDCGLGSGRGIGRTTSRDFRRINTREIGIQDL